MKEMKLSVIIVNWNTRDLVKRCLESITQGLWPKASVEVIVVDNASTDSSVEEIKKIRLKDQDYELKIIENSKNLGFAKAVNQALRQAQGEAFLLLNSDTQVKPSSLEKLVEFEKQVRPAVIGARMLNPDGTVQGSCFYLPTIKRAILEYWLGKKNYFSKFAPLGKEPVEVESVSGGAMLISRAVMDKIGMLDERYFMYFEDLDYCRRVRKAGLKVYYLPSSEIIHEHGVSGNNLTSPENQWKRLIPSSKIYHGSIKHFVLTLIILFSQKIKK